MVGGLGAVLISTAAGMYDVRQLQLGSAAGSSPVWALLADRLLLRRYATQSFWGESVCRWGVLTRDGGFSSAIQSFGGESVCRGKEKGDLQMFPAATQSFCPESVCRWSVLGVGFGRRGMQMIRCQLIR